MHAGDEPDDAHNRPQNRRCPALLNLGHHQKIDRAAQQCAAHRHIEGQNRIGGEENAAHKGEHEKECGKDTNGDKILYRKTFFLNGLHD